jgi:hypothetical protein
MKGLQVLEMLPESPGRDREELASLLTLGRALHALKGLGAPEAERVFVRALPRLAMMQGNKMTTLPTLNSGDPV